MANQHTTSALSGLQLATCISACELRLLWEAHGKIRVIGNGCWEWLGSKTSTGYGHVSVGGRFTGSHRLAWHLIHGSVPDGLCVLHNCPGGDNPACVNPLHLFLGTCKDNTQDMIRKGRSKLKRGNRVPIEKAARGEAHGLSKLTAEKVREIRRRAAAGEPLAALARFFGVSRQSISSAVHRQTWGHVD